ncbi:MAG: hypothetical protein KatS3mg105_3316 [Gemmatales bacterium]|nr:MAG: hypothetical protein KatS3mg105_3316 [Gemmatales bacterium]
MRFALFYLLAAVIVSCTVAAEPPKDGLDKRWIDQHAAEHVRVDFGGLADLARAIDQFPEKVAETLHLVEIAFGTGLVLGGCAGLCLGRLFARPKQ